MHQDQWRMQNYEGLIWKFCALHAGEYFFVLLVLDYNQLFPWGETNSFSFCLSTYLNNIGIMQSLTTETCTPVSWLLNIIHSSGFISIFNSFDVSLGRIHSLGNVDLNPVGACDSVVHVSGTNHFSCSLSSSSFRRNRSCKYKDTVKSLLNRILRQGGFPWGYIIRCIRQFA